MGRTSLREVTGHRFDTMQKPSKPPSLTHLDQSMDYLSLLAELPEHVEPAYDGLEIDLG